MAMKRDVMLKPPKARPDEDDPRRADFPESFQLVDSRRIVRWRPPILAVSFQKRDRPLLPQLAANLFFIHQNERFREWDEPVDFSQGLAQTPRICRLHRD